MSPQPAISKYSDFVIFSQRKNEVEIQTWVYASPVGDMLEPIMATFSAAEAETITKGFYSSLKEREGDKLRISLDQAATVGKRLSAILFIGPVFQLFAESLAKVVYKTDSGIRIRLALDPSLMDLPWEYIYRPDYVEDGGLSNFLLLDPRISLVREVANPRIRIEPITAKAQLSFVGTFWDGKEDHWQVLSEFNQLKESLNSVSDYIEPSFKMAGRAESFSANVKLHTAIFHYAGHCDFDDDNRAFLIRDMPSSGVLEEPSKIYLDDLGSFLKESKIRLLVMSACNSGFWQVVKPLLIAQVPAVVGINGWVNSLSAIAFFTKLYEFLAIGLTLDEALGRARLHLLQSWQELEATQPGHNSCPFDWGVFMVYMPSPNAVLFPKAGNLAVADRQNEAREEYKAVIQSTQQYIRDLDGLNFGEIMSELTKRRVLILGRFSDRRLQVLEAIKKYLINHPNQYIPELFTFDKPELRDLIESITGFAALSRFIIADLSEPKSIQSELQAIVERFLSVPVVPVIIETEVPYATFTSIERRENIVKPLLKYDGLDDLLTKLNSEVILKAEAKLTELKSAL